MQPMSPNRSHCEYNGSNYIHSSMCAQSLVVHNELNMAPFPILDKHTRQLSTLLLSFI